MIILKKIVFPMSMVMISVVAIIALGLIPGAMAALGIHKAVKTGEA